MSSNVYHREVYMHPKVAAFSNVRVEIKATRHASAEAAGDRYGALTIPASVTFDGKDVVEAEFEAGALAKLVVRLPYDARRDAVYVLKIDGTLKTVWSNLKSDKHKTLKKELYMPARAV